MGGWVLPGVACALPHPRDPVLPGQSWIVPWALRAAGGPLASPEQRRGSWAPDRLGVTSSGPVLQRRVLRSERNPETRFSHHLPGD